MIKHNSNDVLTLNPVSHTLSHGAARSFGLLIHRTVTWSDMYVIKTQKGHIKMKTLSGQAW